MTEAAPGTGPAGYVDARRPDKSAPLAALRHRDFRIMWIGLAISNVGGWMQQFALGWFVVLLAAKDGRPELGAFYLGLLGLARAVPGLGLGLVAGVAADRFDRRRLLAATQVVAAASSASLAIATGLDRADLAVVLLLQIAISTAFAFEVPSRQAMVTQIVPGRDVMSAVGLNSVGFNGATIVGPLIGGALIGRIGIPGLLAIHAISYVGVLIALAVVRPGAQERPPTTGSVFGSIREGLAYLRRDPVLAWVILIAILVAIFARPYVQLLPAIARELDLGPVELSWLLASCGAGAVTGAATTASIGNVRRRGLVLVVSAVAIGAFCIALGAQRTLAGALVSLALASIATQLFLGLLNTMLQTGTPGHMRGRAMSVHALIMLGMLPLGTMALGTLGSLIGVLNAVVIGGTVVAGGAAVAAVRAGAVRRYGAMAAA